MTVNTFIRHRHPCHKPSLGSCFILNHNCQGNNEVSVRNQKGGRVARLDGPKEHAYASRGTKNLTLVFFKRRTCGS